MSKHTQTPWDIEPTIEGKRLGRIINKNGDAELGTYLIADCFWPENAEHIIRCVNSHDELVQAVIEMRREAEAIGNEEIAAIGNRALSTLARIKAAS